MRNLTSGLINLNLQGNDLSSFKNGVASSIDDNLLFGAIKWLCKKNDAAHENDYYFMLGKTKTDAAFLASFLLTVKGSVESAYRAIMNSTAAAGFAIVTSETAIGGLIGGMAATEELIRAGILTGVSIVASAMVTRTTNILYMDAKKFKRIIDKAKAEAIDIIKKAAKQKRNLLLIICCCAVYGKCPHTSSGPYGLFNKKTAPCSAVFNMSK